VVLITRNCRHGGRRRYIPWHQAEQQLVCLVLFLDQLRRPLVDHVLQSMSVLLRHLQHVVDQTDNQSTRPTRDHTSQQRLKQVNLFTTISCDETWNSHSPWLRVRERITFKPCRLVYKAMNGPAPSYMKELCVPVTTVATRSGLRSAASADLVPRTRRQLGNRAFSVAGPTGWNGLPLNIQTDRHRLLYRTSLRHICFPHPIICSNC